ncbi:DUF4176 domain-containing protein [Bifidobacterium sp. ESL0769]|uniref:DUF4176 domain-containing protein n=1 Tax=Bifidobacterium sp. ESL0769 TaxID=2983229 RepID=UPI0023F6418D|nr:DUF4176 domain-containing protein [Bifidobacterium sp. ESL0769]WEV66958.1 DUF4176 domain-containing protein [Bifidobacterium sp. ESL0769]
MFRTDEWLPIGSVVHVEDTNRLLMIAGAMQRDEATGKLWDYMGYPYPEGSTDPLKGVLFNKSGVDGVYSIGYLPAEGLNYLQMLKENEPEYLKAKAQASSGADSVPADDGDEPAGDGGEA